MDIYMQEEVIITTDVEPKAPQFEQTEEGMNIIFLTLYV